MNFYCRLSKSIFTGLLIATAASGVSAQSQHDTRQSISVTSDAREHVLTEMRMLLESVHSILESAIKKDMQAVAASAEKVGLKAMSATPPETANQLPQEFKMMGRGVHEAMDMIARDARDLGDSEHTLQQLSETLGNCVACHATFKLQ